MAKKSYLQEAHDYYWDLWGRLMAARLRRGVVIRAGTLASLGGASALQALLAACAGGGAQQAGGGVFGDITDFTKPLPEGQYKYSRYPFVEKYNWRLLPWGGTPYLGGHAQEPNSPPSRWDLFRTNLSSHGGRTFSVLGHMQYGPGVHMERVNLEGDLATEFKPAPDFSYWDFPLHRGVRFHNKPPVNGRELTADDIKYNFERYRIDSLWTASLDGIDRIEVLDRYTVRFYLKRPLIWFPALVSSSVFWIGAKEHIEGDRDYFNNQPIGTGPYQVDFYKYQDRTEKPAHPEYFRRDPRWPDLKEPFLRQNDGYYFADAAAQRAAFRSGQIDYTSITDITEYEDLIATNPNSVIGAIPQDPNVHTWILFQHNNPVLADVRVRRALSMGIDRKRINDTITGGLWVASYPMNYDHMGYDQPLLLEECGPYWQYNPTEARRLLAEAGYGNGLEVELITTSPPADTYLLIQEQWREIGVNLKFVEQEATVVTATRDSHRFPWMIIGTSISGYDMGKQAVELFAKDSPLNWGNVNDPVLEDLVWRSYYSLDPDERVRLFRQINDRALDQVYHLWIRSTHRIHIRHPWLHNVADNIHSWFCCWGSWQWAIAWIDDTAPAGRGGRRAT